jgi:hypothetical protein
MANLIHAYPAPATGGLFISPRYAPVANSGTSDTTFPNRATTEWVVRLLKEGYKGVGRPTSYDPCQEFYGFEFGTISRPTTRLVPWKLARPKAPDLDWLFAANANDMASSRSEVENPWGLIIELI